MQDTRANMGAHLKWDIPMFLGIASTKDGRARAAIMSSTRHNISRLRKALRHCAIILLPRLSTHGVTDSEAIAQTRCLSL